jgi:sensor domain CHASE-containing protein
MNKVKVILPFLPLAAAVVAGLVAWGEMRAKAEEAERRIEKVERAQERISRLAVEQAAIKGSASV